MCNGCGKKIRSSQYVVTQANYSPSASANGLPQIVPNQILWVIARYNAPDQLEPHRVFVNVTNSSLPFFVGTHKHGEQFAVPEGAIDGVMFIKV